MAIQFGSNSVDGIYYGSSKIARVYCGANMTWESPGALTVNYSNPPSGAQWSVDGGTNYHDFGVTINLVAGAYTITYKSVSNYVTPSNQSVTVTVGGDHVVTANQYVAYGTLRVNYTGTAPSGAQWTHDGGTNWTNFGTPVSVTPGTYTISYKTVNGYTAPSSTSATVTAGNTTTITADAYTQNASTGTLLVKTSNTLPSGAAWSIDGGTTWNYTFGSPGVAVPVGETLTITFKQVAGYTTPASQSVTITSTGEETVWLNSNAYVALVLYVEYPMDSSGNRAPSGAQWSIDGGTTWNNFRVDVSPVPAGTYTITYKPVTGYGTPANESVTITGSTVRTQHEIASNNRYVAYGVLTVHLTDNAGGAGRWFVNGTEYASDASATLAPGSYTVTFKAISGYATPASQTATVTSSSTTTLTAEYTAQSAGGNGYIVINDKQSNGRRSGIYTLVSGTENSAATYANGGSLWKHQTLPYYFYNAGTATSYWYLSSVPGSTSGDAEQVSSAGGNPTSVFIDAPSMNNVTITYVIGTAPSGAHLTVWNTAGSHTYTGEYYLYSGTANTTSAVWKKADGNYYILMNPSGSEGGWTIYNAASTSGTNLVRLGGSRVASAETAFNGGLTTGNYVVFYSDGVAGSASTQYPDSIALTFPESFEDGMSMQTVTIDDAFNGTYAYSGECKVFSYVDDYNYTTKYVVQPVYVNGTKTLCQGTNPADVGGFGLYWCVGTMGNVTYVCTESPEDSIGVLTNSKNWSFGYSSFKVTGVYDSGLTDSGSGAHITMVNENNAKYDGNYYLTSGSANATDSVWTHFSGKYTLSYNSHWWIHDGSSTIQATYEAGDSVPTSWASSTDFNGIYMTYHAS